MTSGPSDRPGPESRLVEANGVSLACLASPSIDDHDRPLVVCLHGFPDTAHTWRHLSPRLDDAGFRVVAPALRGYAPSSVPADGSAHAGAAVVDVVALHDHFAGDDRARLVGHDWGAAIAYGAATLDADRWAKVVGLAVPPGGALGAALVADLDQLRRSWYMFFFQHPLADLVVPSGDLAFIDMLWRDWSPSYDASDDLPRVKQALGDPTCLSAALGYYRAALGDGSIDPADELAQRATAGVPPQPLLYLHGEDDGCIGVEVAEATRALTGDTVTVEVVPDAGHFLHLETPSVVDHHILEFLT
jgi:pimeloyl-ACP methyl ester carboxylesterase